MSSSSFRSDWMVKREDVPMHGPLARRFHMTADFRARLRVVLSSKSSLSGRRNSS